jgi:exonuclease III
MEDLEIDIIGLSEMRWKGAGDLISNGYKIIHSGGKKHERGVGFIISPKKLRAVKGYWAISDRILLVKISGKPVDINIIQIYAPTSNSSEEDIEIF